MYDFFVQLLGVIALVSALLSFQQKKRSRLMLMQTIASLLFSVQLFLLGAITGGCTDLVSFIRNMIFARNTKSKWAKSPIWLVLFILIIVLIGILTWDNIFSLLAVLGSIFSTIALWMKDEKNIRRISLLVGPCWIIYNFYHGSIAGVLNEVIAMTSIIIAIFRLDVKRGTSEK